MSGNKLPIDIFDQIKSRIDVSSITCDGEEVWPIICATINESKITSIPKKTPTSIRGSRNFFKYFFNKIMTSLPQKKSKIEFNNLVLVRRDEIRKYSYSGVMENYKNYLSNLFKGEIYFFEQENKNPHYIEYKRYKNFSLSKYSKIRLENLDKLINIISDFDCNFNFKLFKRKILDIFLRSEAIERTLKNSEFNGVVYSTVYYSNNSFALTRAARKLGLKVVEIQHGQQGRTKPMWNELRANLDTSFYFPNYTFVWGSYYKDLFIKKEKAFICGNPFLPKKTVVKREAKSLNRILFAMQPIENTIPEHVLAVKDELKNYEWTFRLHPQNVKNIDTLRTSYPNIKFEFPTNSLWEELKSNDVVITCYSTVAFEGIYFDAKSIFVHEYAKKLFNINDLENFGIKVILDKEALKEEIFNSSTGNVSLLFENNLNFIEKEINRYNA